MVAPQDAGGPQGHVREGVDLSAYDGKRIALIVCKPDGAAAVRGTACYTQDGHLGSVLRISLDKIAEGMPVFVISEADWRGRIYPDLRFGCDYCFDSREL